MSSKCRFMQAAYPMLDADETCGDHRHDLATFSLASAMASRFQQHPPTDEQVAWFLDDAAAIVDDFAPAPVDWTVTEPEHVNEIGVDFTFDVNGVEYVMEENDSGGHVVGHPLRRSTYAEQIAEANR